MNEHTIEPYMGIIRESEQVDWDADVRLAYVSTCNHCGSLIESNDPDYRWFHVDE